MQADAAPACLSCNIPFPDKQAQRPAAAPNGNGRQGGAKEAEAVVGYAASSRYQCPRCKQHFCIECDAFVHETLHTCPGCC